MFKKLVLGICLLLPTPVAAQGTIRYVVNSSGDASDADPGDGACIAVGGGCTLRAAIEQANAMGGDEAIEIKIQVSEITLEQGNGTLRVRRNGIAILGPTIEEISETPAQLPVLLFGEAAALGAVVRPQQDAPAFNAFTLEATDLTLAGLEIFGFQTAIWLGSSQEGEPVSALLTRLAIHDNQIGIKARYLYETAISFTVSSSAIYSNREIGIAGPRSVEFSCIGTLPDCKSAAGNEIGITALGGPIIARSVISGNDVGVSIGMGGGAIIQQNKIGTDHTGRFDVGNRVGVFYEGEYVSRKALITENVISGNDEIGVHCGRCGLEANLIGTDATGTSAIPNLVGARIFTASTASGWAVDNVISGNGSNGIEIECGLSGGLQGNIIGMDATGQRPLGNGGHGVYVPTCQEDTGYSVTMPIGGTEPDEQNTIAYNEGDGIRLGSDEPLAFWLWSVEIMNNAIHDNKGLGIGVGDAVPDWPAPPSVDAVQWSDTAVEVNVSATGVPDRPHVFEVYANRLPDPSGFGEGARPLMRVPATSDSDGLLAVSLSIPHDDIAAGEWVTATVTDTREPLAWPGVVYSTTSPFSRAVQVLETASARIAVEPETIDFGPVAVGASTVREVAIRNNGMSAMQVEIATAEDFTGNGFRLEGDGAMVLEGGEERSLLVFLEPGSLGPKASSLRIAHDAPNTVSPVIVSLTGQGVSGEPSLLVSGTEVEFGTVVVGSAADIELVVSNTGGGRLEGEVLPGADFTANGFQLPGGQGPFTLGGGESVTILIRLKPGSVGEKQSSLLLTHNAGTPESPVIVNVHGEGARGTGQILVEPLVIDFGPVEVGTTQIDSLRVSHAGGDDRLIGSVSDFGDLADQGIYFVSGGGLFDLAPGQYFLTRLAFSPSEVGPVSAQLKINHNGQGPNQNVLVELQGSGIAPEDKPRLMVSAGDSLRFGEVPLGAHADRSLVLSNQGNAPLELRLSVPQETGIFSTPWEEVNLAAGASETIEIRFEPGQEGTAAGRLLIQHNDPSRPNPLSLGLSGAGIPAGALGTPKLLAPPDSAFGVAAPVTFRWDPVATANSYVLEISSEADFQTTIVQVEVEETNAVVIDLPDGSTFWRITARREGISNVSPAWNFTTQQPNRPPVAVTDSVTTLVGQAVLVDVLANDFDEDGHALRISRITEPPLNGVAVATSQMVEYTPNPGFRGMDRLSYRIVDIFGTSGTADVYITVTSGTGLDDGALPPATLMARVYPNPVGSLCHIELSAAGGKQVRVSVYDALGRRVGVVYEGIPGPGVHDVRMPTDGLSPGLYLVVAEQDNRRESRGFVVAR